MKGRVIQESEFDSLLVDSVDEALTDVLGMQFTDKFFTLLETELQISKPEIPRRLDNFTSVLSTVFGSRAALVMGRAIGETVYTRLEIPLLRRTVTPF